MGLGRVLKKEYRN